MSRRTGARQRLAALSLVAILAPAAACLNPLPRPPALAQLAGAPAADGPQEARDLIRLAEDLFGRRTLTDADAAATLYLRAAAAPCSAGEESCALRGTALAGAARIQAWMVERLDNPAAREERALAAVHAAQWCRRSAPGAACDYWFGAALGLRARERRRTGLPALPEIEAAFRRAAAADPLLEDAGPHRALALFYLRAPGWPVGPGDPDLGLSHARQAVDLAPRFPPNHLALAEALRATGDRDGERAALEEALFLARERPDHPDAGDWIDAAERALSAGKRKRMN